MNAYDDDFESLLRKLNESARDGGINCLLETAEHLLSDYFFMFWEQQYIGNAMMKGSLEKSLHYQEWKIRDYAKVGEE